MKDKIILFYQKDFSRIKQLHSRHYFEAFVLILNKEIQLMAILLSDLNSSNFFEVFFKVIIFAKIHPIVCWKSTNESCPAYFSIGIASIVLIQIIVLYLFIFHRNLFYKTQKEIKSHEELKNNKSKTIQNIPLSNYEKNYGEVQGEKSSFFTIPKTIFATFFQTFQYFFFQPFFYLFLQNFIDGLQEANTQITGIGIYKIASGVSVLPLLFFFFIFAEIHKTSNKFNDTDAMGVYSNKYNHYFTIINLCLIVSKVISDQYQIPLLTLVVSFMYYFLLYWTGNFYCYYMNQSLQLLQNCLSAQLALLFILLTIREFITLQESDLVEYFIFLSPILLSVTIKLYDMHQRQIILFQKIQNCDGRTLDWQLRFIYSQCQFIFLKKRENFNKTKNQIFYSLILHNIVSNHVYQCNGLSKSTINETPCFCLDYFPNSKDTNCKAAWDKYIKHQTSDYDETRKEDIQIILSEKEFQHFILDYIKNEYEFFLKKRKIVSIEVSLSYVYFIIEILKIPTKAFYETLNLYRVASFNSIKNKMLIFQLLTTSKKQFNELVRRKDIKNQKYNHQVCFLLDKSISIVIQNIFQTVSLLKKWLDILINQSDDHVAIFNKGQKILGNIQIIEVQLNQMFKANPLSSEIESLYIFYYKFLNLHQKRNPLYKKNSKIANEFINSYNRLAFSKDSCIVSISFLHPIGRIVRFTNNFAIFCGVYDKSELINININRFMPDLLSRSHDQYLQNFIEKGRMNIVNSEQRFILIKTKEEFVVPVIAKIKLEDAYDDDFGASAILIKVNTPYHYLLLNKYCLLEEISKNLFQVFSSLLNCSINQIKSIDFLLLIPQLLFHWQQYSEQENNEEVFYTKTSSQFITTQQIFEVSLILPKGQDLIDYLFKRQPIKKKNLIKYFQQHKSQMQQYFQKLEDFDLFNLKIKIIPVVTIYENVYILEVQSIKQYKKMLFEEKQDKVRVILNQVFPFSYMNSELKNGNINDYINSFKEDKIIDIANLEEFIALEEDQMGDLVSQNLSKMLLTNTASNKMRLLSLQNENYTVQGGNICQISSTEIPSFPLVIQSNNVISNQQNPQNSVSDDFTESSSPINQQGNNNENNDQQSISSTSRYQGQFAKRILIRQAIFEKQGDTHQIWLSIFRLGFLGLLIQSTIIFILLLKFNQNANTLDYLQHIGKFSELFDKFIIYTQCLQDVIDCEDQNRGLLFNLSDSLKNLTNFMNSNIDFTPCLESDFSNSNIEYEISYLYNLMHDIVYEQQKDENDLILIEEYYCYKDVFHQIDEKLDSEYNIAISRNEQELDTSYIVGLIFILIFCGLFIPFELIQERARFIIMRLFQTLSRQQLTNQLQMLQSLAEYNNKSDLTSKEFVIDDVLDSSKSKYEPNETRNFVKISSNANNQNNRGKGNQKYQILKKNFINIPIKILATLFVLLLLQSYFSLSYLLYMNDSTVIEKSLHQVTQFNTFSSSVTQMSGEIAILSTQYFNGTIFKIFANKMKGNSLKNTANINWQQLIKQLAEDSNLELFSTTNFCEIFLTSGYENSIYNFKTCSSIESLQNGFIIIMTSISDFYDQIVQMLENNESQIFISLENDFPAIQIKSLFIIKALDILKDNMMELNQSPKYYLQIIIFTLYIVILCLTHIYGIYYVTVQILQSLEKAKRLLSLVPMETLLENAHVMSFVLKEQRKKKY